VDDVVTTGSTLAACSDALRASGARAVELYAFARAI
jgi:predicted amidophosphoribosyltransferase